MLDWIDPFALKDKFDGVNVLRQELGDLRQDARFLDALRRALLPPPLGGRRVVHDTTLFPPLEVRPHPVLAGKRVGLVTSGGSGALVTLCGVKRALEEAAVDVAAISVCSGSAIWGSMIAAGLAAQEMVDLCLNWRPEEILDVDWAGIATFPLRLGRGFDGIARGLALERTLDRAYRGMTLGETKVPYYAIVLDIDRNELGYMGPHNRPDVRLATMARVAIALPLFVKPVEIGGTHYVDGGVVNIFPVAPLLELEKPLDYLIGVNVILPPGFRGEDISGWRGRPLSILEPSRQLYHAQWIALARQQLEAAGDRMLLLEPLPYTEIAGSKFFEIFIDNIRWPAHILTAYRYTRDRLASFEG